jgi:hypothetical protein
MNLINLKYFNVDHQIIFRRVAVDTYYVNFLHSSLLSSGIKPNLRTLLALNSLRYLARLCFSIS